MYFLCLFDEVVLWMKLCWLAVDCDVLRERGGFCWVLRFWSGGCEVSNVAML